MVQICSNHVYSCEKLSCLTVTNTPLILGDWQTGWDSLNFGSVDMVSVNSSFPLSKILIHYIIKGSWEAILPCYGQIEVSDLK